MKLKLLIVFLAIAMERARAVRLSRATGGQLSMIEEAPFMVAIKNPYQIVCGGALITIKHIITAAHCVVDDDLKPYRPARVILGAGESIGSGTSQPVHKYTVHRYYDPADLQNDVAIITLKSVITVNEVHRPIPLSIDPPPLREIAELYAYGTPVLSESTFIHRVPFKVYNMSRCMKNDENLHLQFCGIGKGRSAAIFGGDSGSPLVYDGALIGILSWAYDDISRKVMFMNINYYSNFIRCVVRPESLKITP